MGIEALIQDRLHSLSRDQQFAVLGYIDRLLVESGQEKPFPATKVEDGLGCVGYRGPRKSLGEMRDGLVAEAKRRWLQEDRG